jgi:hypothetical protein
MAVRLSVLCAGLALPPWRFLVLNSVREWMSPRAIVRLEGLGKLKKSDIIWNRTRVFPACSIVPQLTTCSVPLTTEWVHDPVWMWWLKVKSVPAGNSAYSQSLCYVSCFILLNLLCMTEKSRIQQSSNLQFRKSELWPSGCDPGEIRRNESRMEVGFQRIERSTERVS